MRRIRPRRPPVLVHQIDHNATAPRLARAALVPWLNEAEIPVKERVELVVSELVSNVVQHTSDGGTLRLWDADPGAPLQLEVSDHELGHLVSPSRPNENGGRGLRIVAALADAWGIEFDVSGKVIWAEFSARS